MNTPELDLPQIEARRKGIADIDWQWKPVTDSNEHTEYWIDGSIHTDYPDWEEAAFIAHAPADIAYLLRQLALTLAALDGALATVGTLRDLQAETARTNGVLNELLQERGTNVVVLSGTVAPPAPKFPAKWWYLEDFPPFIERVDPADWNNYYGPFDTYSEAFQKWAKEVSYDGPMFAAPRLPTEGESKGGAS